MAWSVARHVVWAAVFLASTMASGAEARIIVLRFSGTYDTAGSVVFGESGHAVPYAYEITYDTDLDTNLEYYAQGASMGAWTTTHEWHGHSASGIVAASLSFGTMTFDPSWIECWSTEAGVCADLWFDVDLAGGSPTRSVISIWDLAGNGDVLLLGIHTTGSSGTTYMDPASVIDDILAGGGGVSRPMTITEVSPSAPVPGPGGWLVPAMLGAGLAGTRLAQAPSRRAPGSGA